MKKVAFHTLGCKTNLYETNGMIQKFLEAKYEIVDFDQFADIYVINTCTVTNVSDRKSRQMLRRAKEVNQNALVVAVGCYAQVAKEDLEQIEEIDLILGTNEKKDIVNYIEKYLEDNENNIELDDVLHNPEYSDFGAVSYTEKTRAVIKVQDGCDRFCSYCIIPYARGRVRSRKPKRIIEEATKISSEGIKEIVITGIHIASYGKDFKEDYALIDLLEELNKVEGLERIRLGSIEPLLITDEFVERLIKLEKVCHHFHLSLQSGCTQTLKRMNRRYTAEEFEEVTKRLRKAYNNAILTTDIIVGFPGETDEEFEETYKFLSKTKFYKMHVFKYSVRKGTKAASMKNQVRGDIKELRSKRLLELSDKNEKEYLDTYIGQTVKVLFEEEVDGKLKGHTENYIMVSAKSTEDLSNQIKAVCIEGIEGLELTGIVN